jgi:hypothetical protein
MFPWGESELVKEDEMGHVETKRPGMEMGDLQDEDHNEPNQTKTSEHKRHPP